jgi:nucleotide-binding universal stress UspA family protein
MNPAQVTPEMTDSERDSDGRLVKFVIDSKPAPETPGINPWVIAVDGSACALRAIGHAAAQAVAMRSCALHLVHVQPWLSKEAAETELVQRSLGATAGARALLDARGLPWRLHVAMGDPAERIVEQSRRLGATTVVIGYRGLNAVESLLLGSVANKVIHLSPLPVMLVP